MCNPKVNEYGDIDNQQHNQHNEEESSKAEMLRDAALELEKIRTTPQQQITPSTIESFPSSCLRLLQSLPGNNRCLDCGARNPEWAAVSYGGLVCIECSGFHRQLGVNTSKVRSIMLDSFSHEEILCMLEGGNDQANKFFTRHGMSSLPCQSNNTTSPPQPNNVPKNSVATTTSQINNERARRYVTNAALFYRKNLLLHVQKVKQCEYKGRDAFRRLKRQKSDGKSKPEKIARGERPRRIKTVG